jgi:putative membrane protein insertion efficiency factor
MMKFVVVGLIRGYQRYVSPFTRPSCRYVPTCSEYAVQSVSKYGALRGLWLAAKRISRCHPLHEGEYDPVP